MGYCSWVSVSTSFSPGRRKKKNMFYCAIVVQQFVFITHFKIRWSAIHSSNMQQSRVSGVISMFDGRQVWRSSHSACWLCCQNDLSWHREREAHRVLYATLECHHFCGPVLNLMEQAHMTSQQPDNDCYDPLTWLVAAVIYLSLITHSITWICD